MTRSVNGFACRAAVFALVAAVVAGGMADVRAADYWWTGTTSGTTWSTVGNWSTLFSIGGSAPSAPGAGDTAFFNQTTLNTAQTITVNGTTSIGGIVFNNTTATTLQGDGTQRYLSLGSSGIRINTGAGAVGLGTSGGANGTNLYVVLGANQTWRNNSANALSINGVVSAAGSTSATLTIGGSGNTQTTGNGTAANQGRIINPSGGTTAVVKVGSGTLTFNEGSTGAGGVNAFTGGLTVNAGRVAMNSTNTTSSGMTNIIGNQALTMGGGQLSALWQSSVTTASNNQNFTSLTLNTGASLINVNTTLTSTSANAIVNLNGTTTRNAGATLTLFATGGNALTNRVYFYNPSWNYSGAILDNGVAYVTAFGSNTSTPNPSSFADTWGAVGNGYLTNNSFSVSYTAADSSTLSGNADIGSGVDTTLATSQTSTTLRMNRAEARTVDIGGNTYTTGGILVTSTVGANTFTISNGTLRSAATVANKDLVFILNNATGTTAVSAVIANAAAGATGLTKSGVGTLSLTGANTYTGPTYINGGTLLVGSDGTGSSNPLGNYPGSVTAGAITLNGGALQATTGLTLAANRGVTLLGNGGTLDATSGQTLTVSGVIAGAAGTGALTKGSAGGNLTLNAANTFTGGLVINSGTVTLGNAGALNSTAGSENVVTMALGSTANVLALNGNSITIADLRGSGAVGSTPPVVQNGGAAAVTLTIGNAENYSGSTFNGVIQDGGAGALNLVKTGNGTLTLSPQIIRSASTTLNSTWITVSDTSYLQVGTAVTVAGFSGTPTISTILSGSVQLSGSATASGTASASFVQKLSTYTGTTTIASGQLNVTSNALSTTTPLIIGDATSNTPGVLFLNGSQTVSSLTSAGSAGSSNKVLATSPFALTITGATASGAVVDSTFSGNIGEGTAAAVALTLGGTGGYTVTLSGSNAYTGATTLGPNAALKLTNVNAMTTGTYKNASNSGTYTLQFAAGASMSSTTSVIDFSVNASNATTGSFSFDGSSQTVATFRIGQKNTFNFASTTGSPTFTVTGTTFLGTTGNSVNQTQTLVPTGGVSVVLNQVYAETPSAGSSRTYTLVLDGTTTGNKINGGIFDVTVGSTTSSIAVTKQSTSTWTLSGPSTFSGGLAVRAGAIRFDSVGAGSAAQALGAGSTVNLGVAATSAGEIDYFGAGGTLDKNVFALGSGRNRIRNSGVGTLVLSGTLTKNGTILELAGGTFDVTGRITGSLANSDLFINGANVTLSSTNNDYNGPTYVYGNGTLTLGAGGVIPNGSALLLGGTGADTGSGSIVTGTFTDTVASLTSSAAGGTVGITVTGATAGGLTMGGLTLGGSTDTLALSLSSPTLGRYQLLTYTGLRSGTFDSVTGLAGSNYTLVYGSASNSSIDLQMKADQAATFSLTPAASRVLAGGSTTLSGSIVNASPTGAAALAWSPTVTGSLTGVTSSAGSSIAAGGTSTISATFLAGNTAGTQSWSVVNTDANAITTTSTASGSIDVVNQRQFSLSSGTIALGNFLRTAAVSGSTTITSTGLHAVTADATILGFSGTATNGFGLGLATPGANVFNGTSAVQQAVYAVSGSAASAGAFTSSFASDVQAELGSIASLAVVLTGTAYDAATASLASGGAAFGSNWTTNLGEFNQGAGSSSPWAFVIANLLQSQDYTADLELLSLTTTEDSGAIFMDLTDTNFTTLQAGQTQSFSAWMSLANTGTFTNVYNLSFTSAKDGASLGGVQNTTLTVTGVIIVPEPTSLALAVMGLAASWMMVRRRR